MHKLTRKNKDDITRWKKKGLSNQQIIDKFPKRFCQKILEILQNGDKKH